MKKCIWQIGPVFRGLDRIYYLLPFQHYPYTSFISNSPVFAWTRANEYHITPIRHSYLASIHLMHIKNGCPDPTTDESLHLLCRGIRRQQSSSRLLITINLLRTLKSQLCSSQMSLLEQCLLWTAFIVIP